MAACSSSGSGRAASGDTKRLAYSVAAERSLVSSNLNVGSAAQQPLHAVLDSVIRVLYGEVQDVTWLLTVHLTKQRTTRCGSDRE